MQPMLERTFASSAFARHLTGVDVEALLAAGKTLLEEQPRTRAELKPLLAAQWPAHDADSLTAAIGFLLPVVQIPPRGLWRERGQPRLATVAAWLGRPLEADASPDEAILRYLAAFGPATTADMRTWSRLSGLRVAIERLRPRLITCRDERGRELFDLPDAPRPDPDSPAPPRFLPEYDNILLSHADRSRIIPDNVALRLPAGRGGELGTVLVDGMLAGMWRIARERDRARLTIEPAGRWSAADRAAVADEGDRLLAFVASETGDRDVRVSDKA
jgi:hypothetical protein